MMGKDTDKIIKELFDLIVDRCQESLEPSMEGISFVFKHFNELRNNSHKKTLRCGRSYMDSPNWIKSE